MDDMGNLRSEVRWIIAGAVIVSVTFLVCLTVLAYEGKTSEDLSRILNSGLNLLTIILAGGAYWRAGRADNQATGARAEARTAAEQTNGQLEERIANAVSTALDGRPRSARVP